MAEVQLYKRGTGNDIIIGVDGTADSARLVSLGLGVAAPASGLQIASGSLVAAGGSIDLDPTGTYALDMDAGQTATFTVSDNQASALLIQEGANPYLDITTTNGSESITLGDDTINPSISMVGGGGVSLSDPTGNATFLSLTDGDSAAVSAANSARFRYNETDDRMELSENTGSYERLVPFANEATATADTTTTSATDTQVNAMTLTPAAGTYMVWFTGSVDHSSNNSSIFTSIYNGGTQVASSEREFGRGAGQGDVTCSFACVAIVTVDGATAITGQWRTDAATATMHERTLHVVEVHT